MPITKGPSVPSFFTSKGISYPTLELAQHAELFQLIKEVTELTEEQTTNVCTSIYSNRGDICEILRATGRKPRKAKATVVKRTCKAGVKEAE